MSGKNNPYPCGGLSGSEQSRIGTGGTSLNGRFKLVPGLLVACWHGAASARLSRFQLPDWEGPAPGLGAAVVGFGWQGLGQAGGIGKLL